MSQKEYPRHWRCRVCGKDSPITAPYCVNARCQADLAIHGEVVFEAATDTGEGGGHQRRWKGWVIALAAVVLLVVTAWMLRPVLFDHEAEPTQPVTTEPATTESAATEPPTTEPRTAVPPTTEPRTAVPPTTEPPTTEPPTTEPPTTEPPTTEPPTTEPPTTEPINTMPIETISDDWDEPNEEI